VNSLPKTVIRQRRHCDLNPGPSAPESSTLTTWLPSHRLSFSLKNSFSGTLFVLFVVPRARLNWLTVSFCAHVNAIFIHSFFGYIPFYFTATQAQHENTAYCVVRSSVVCLCVCLSVRVLLKRVNRSRCRWQCGLVGDRKNYVLRVDGDRYRSREGVLSRGLLTGTCALADDMIKVTHK